MITLSRGGFQPKEITRPQGRFFLVVGNQGELQEVNLRLDRVAGGRLHEAKVSREEFGWTELLNLTPGRYQLSEAGHPDWVCNITITPH